MYEKQRDIKHFRWRHTFHFKPPSFFFPLLFIWGRGNWLSVWSSIMCGPHLLPSLSAVLPLWSWPPRECPRVVQLLVHLSEYKLKRVIDWSRSSPRQPEWRCSAVVAWLLGIRRRRRWRNKAGQPLVKRRLTVSYCLRRLWLPIRHFYSHNHRT